MLAQNFIKQSKKSLSEYISNYDQEGFATLSNSLPFMKDAVSANKALDCLINDAYKRVSKKIPKKKLE
ncbi:hypothetical protein PCURB6_26950 [Paenibacillus curdlanolyticus]|nr:hypothetical protein PCURB6_26950 [Paenibacillus curdlanolyticus]